MNGDEQASYLREVLVGGLGPLGPQAQWALPCFMGGLATRAPAAHQRGTYTLLPVHSADAAEGAPVADASLQASLWREAGVRPRQGKAPPNVTQPGSRSGCQTQPGWPSLLYLPCFPQCPIQTSLNAAEAQKTKASLLSKNDACLEMCDPCLLSTDSPPMAWLCPVCCSSLCPPKYSQE